MDINSKHWWAQIKRVGINAKYNVVIDTKWFSKSRNKSGRNPTIIKIKSKRFWK